MWDSNSGLAEGAEGFQRNPVLFAEMCQTMQSSRRMIFVAETFRKPA